MVEQGGELCLLPFPCHFAHTLQPLGYANLALCRVRAGLMGVLLDQRPSLLALRRQFPVFVRVIHRTVPLSDPSKTCARGVRLFAFPRRPVVEFTTGTSEVSRFS